MKSARRAENMFGGTLGIGGPVSTTVPFGVAPSDTLETSAEESFLWFLARGFVSAEDDGGDGEEYTVGGTGGFDLS